MVGCGGGDGGVWWRFNGVFLGFVVVWWFCYTVRVLLIVLG